MKIFPLVVVAVFATSPVFAEEKKAPAIPPCGETIAECQKALVTAQEQAKEFQAAYQLARQQRDQTASALYDAQLQAAIAANKGK